MLAPFMQHHHLTRLQLSAIERHFYRRQHQVQAASELCTDLKGQCLVCIKRHFCHRQHYVWHDFAGMLSVRQ